MSQSPSSPRCEHAPPLGSVAFGDCFGKSDKPQCKLPSFTVVQVSTGSESHFTAVFWQKSQQQTSLVLIAQVSHKQVGRALDIHPCCGSSRQLNAWLSREPCTMFV